MRVALITGITGQDGSYLAEALWKRGYVVHGIIRRASNFNTQRIDGIIDHLHLHHGDINDIASLMQIIKKTQPDELYNLAAQSHVRVSYELPVDTCHIDGMGVLNVLEAVRQIKPDTRIYQASTSEMFGKSPPKQNEQTPLLPASPYACAKVFAYHLCRNYRDAYGMFISNGILFNHESSRRGRTFVSKKIAESVVKIKNGFQRTLELGNLNALRDWGYAPEYVESMILMLRQSQPDDFVIATGESHTVQEFVKRAFGFIGLNWKNHVVINPRYARPVEVPHLCGDASKAAKQLGWVAKTKFEDLCDSMVQYELECRY